MKLANVATFMLLLAALLLAPFAVQAKDESMSGLSEPEVKAAHIFKFKKYADWPPQSLPPGAPIVIGVAGAEEVAKVLQRLALKRETTHQRVQVKQLQSGETLAGIHILFVGKDKSLELNEWLSRADGLPILLVTDMEQGMPPGSMINFVQENGRTRFDVSLTAAERSQVKLSAALLTVAREVYGGKP